MFRSNFSFKRRSNDEAHQAKAGTEIPTDRESAGAKHQRSLSHDNGKQGPNASLLGVINPSRDSRRLSWDGRANNQQSRRESEADPGPLGLNVVYAPPKTKHKADIVFVHGLGGTSRLTWSKHRNPDLFWPLHFLSQEPDIAQTRVLTFGYDANFRRRGSGSISVLDFAKDLLFELKYAKNEDGDDLEIGVVPLLFVVHSMGGLIIKEAYIQGQNDPDYELIIKAISAITFLATPHRGTELATLLNRILTSTLFSNPKQYITDLNQNSIALQKLNDQFRHIAPKLEIVSFYETQPTPLGIKSAAVMILEKETSVLGYPGETSKALNADHHGICKYDNPQDPNYIIVRNVLKSLLSKVYSNTDSFSKSERSGRRQPQDLRTLLVIKDLPDADYIFYRDQWTEGTGRWVFEDTKYLSWFQATLQSDRPRILWLRSGPGTGKSVLSSVIVNEIVKQGFTCQYFFMRSSDQSKRNLSMLLRSIAYQLAGSVPTFLDHAFNVTDEGIDFGTAHARTVWERLFKTAMASLKQIQQPIYWVVDGIDRATDPRSVIKILSDIPSGLTNIRILLVSRETSEIASAISKIPTTVHVDSISIEGHLDEDFTRHIRQELNLAPSSYREKVIGRLIEGSENNFLWLRLAVDKVNSYHTEVDIDAALHQLPVGMEPFYDRMGLAIAQYESPTDKALATSMLQCIAVSLRVLSVSELSQALHEEAFKILDVQRSIIDLCAGFVIVDNDGKVFIIHQTARQYLLDGHRKRPFLIQRDSAHAHLFMSCMRSLMAVGLRAKLQAHQQPEFLDYAATCWSHHLAAMANDWRPAIDTLGKFLNGPWILIWIYYLSKTSQLGILVQAARHLSVYFARQRQYRHTQPEQDSAQLIRYTLLEGWATDLIKVAGKFGIILRQNPSAIYKLIPPFCPKTSSVYQIFGKSEARNILISGISYERWDDSITRISMDAEAFTSAIAVGGSHIAIMASTGSTMSTFLYDSSTFEAISASPIKHREHVQMMKLDDTGTLLASYSYRKTSLRDVTSGELVFSVDNPKSGLRPLAMSLVRNDAQLLIATDDRCLRLLDWSGGSPSWQTVAEFEEEEIEGHYLNSASFMALSRDASLMAVAYRGHPLSAWEVEGPMQLGHCWRTREEITYGQVIDAVWHPQSPELFGLYTEGILFKWLPYDDDRREYAVGASKLTISTDGSLIATGDARGTVKIFTTAEFSTIYQLTGEDLVLGLAFSPDNRRIYDIRGYHSNAWEPNVLMKMAEQRDKGTEDGSDSVSLSPSSTYSGVFRSGRVDTVIGFATSPQGRLYSYGTDKGDVFLYDVLTRKLNKIYTAKSFFSIEHMEWSHDGQHVAFSYSGKRVVILSLSAYLAASNNEEDVSIADTAATIKIESSGGNALIRQLLFNSASTKLAIFTASTIRLVSMETLAITRTVKVGGISQCQWVLHPSSDRLMVGVAAHTLRVLDWELNEQQSYEINPLPSQGPVPQPEARQDEARNMEPSNGSPFPITTDLKEAIVECVITTRGRKKLLVVQLTLAQPNSRKRAFLAFETSWISGVQVAANDAKRPTSKDGTTQPLVATPITLRPWHFLPDEIANDVLLALDFVSNDQLTYLSRAYAVCTWPTASPANSSTAAMRRSSSPLKTVTINVRPPTLPTIRPGIVRHSSLPNEPSEPGVTPGSKRPPLSRSPLSDSAEEPGSMRSKEDTLTGLGSGPNSASTAKPSSKVLFYLPGEWINRNCIVPCVLWAKEKSLLCPWNGEVAVVKCPALV